MTTRVLDDGARLVTITARSERPVGALELCGELPCWQQPIAMTRAGAVWQARVRAAPGVYEIKTRDPAGAWHVDPAWRTVVRDGALNGVLVVGGTDEPVLHAAAPPWLVARDDGRVTIRAALRHGHGERLAVRVDDGDGPRVRSMRPTGDDGSHRWFELELGAVARAFEYELVLADGRTVSCPDGALALPEAPAPALPAWWRDAVVYTIFVDRFRRAGGSWDDAARWDRDHHAGGDLDGVVEALPYLVDLGATALHLTPIVVAGSQHRYDARDPIAIDPALGGEPAFARLLAAAHARGLRLIVDIAATHVDREFAPFADVRARGPASPYYRWFRVQRWPFVDGEDPGYAHYQHGQWREPLLATDEPEVQDAIVGWFVAWARRGVDGLRVDAAADLPRPLLARIRAAVRAVRADAVVFGEVVPACLGRFVPGALDAATDFPYREALVAWLGGNTPAARLVDVAAERRRHDAAGPRALGFTGTHDQPRLATVVRDRGLARLGLVATALGARVPLLYYGDELDLASDGAARAFEDSWPDRMPMPWDDDRDRTTFAAVRAALALRREHPVLARGDETLRADGDDTIVARRHRPHEAIELALHRGDAPRTLVLDGGPARVLLAVGDAALIAHDPPTLALGPRSLAVVDRRPDPRDEAPLRTHNATIAARAFVDGHVECPAYPTRLYVTVTEACNLQCRHCITDAPARTRGGRARTLQPWLLDALDDAFAHVDYVGFTHGGESLTAPIFPEVLRRIARARARPGRTTVHLVTNGTLLDAERLATIVDLGVSSIMVSLDGATAATNDRVRVLGRFDRVVAHVADATTWRARTGADVRLGISTVIGAHNVAEVPALARLARELGVDWLKLEETYPATAFARHDALAADDPRVVAAVAGARAALGDVVLVDHVAPPAGCGCGDDPRARAFRAADDYANRATFRPCRAAWEQAAIDPDGTVHAIDYAGPALGALVDAPLLALWNAPPAIAVRARALAEASRACKSG